MKKALITGITGQDGSYLAEFLLDKGYHVLGVKRRSSSFNTGRIDHIFVDPHESDGRFELVYSDLTDTLSLVKIIKNFNPDEIYNLAAQSHVAVSFEIPEYTSDVVAMGPLRILEAIRFLNAENKIKFYQASSSELYGDVLETPQTELTPFNPQSPYAIAKQYAFWITKHYREAYGIHACNGILFNHESPRRGETFVTRKITRGLSRVFLGLDKCVHLGNLNAKRDWGHAKDYVRMQWMMLQQDTPDDYVIATNSQHSIREFISWTAEELGFKLEFSGSGEREVAKVVEIPKDTFCALQKGDIVVQVDPKYYRPAEVNTLQGDATKAKEKLGWVPHFTAKQLCREMVTEDLKLALNEKRLSGVSRD